MAAATTKARAGARAAGRYWEIDTLRGVAVIAMVFFHLMWDLFYMGVSQVDVFTAGWQAFARGIGSTFTFLLGLSVALRVGRARRAGALRTADELRRAAVVFGAGLLVSVGTYFAVGDSFVVFGILHMQGLAMLLAFLFTGRRPALTLAVALAMAAAGAALNGQSAPYPWLIWLGLPEAGRPMVDWYPLLPWGAAALLGVVAGQALYPAGERSFVLPDAGGLAPLRALRFLGRHSLPIYLIHQPLLLGALMALGFGSL